MAIPAAVVGNDGVRAVFAARDMSSEGRRAAALNRAHHLQLRKAHMACIGGTPCGSVVAENIRDLQSRSSQHYWERTTPAASLAVNPVGLADLAGS